jgi:eukaryotic-like serine/threonine-protein kinase
MALNPGDVIDGKYRIVRLIGEGGMGAVYEGENARIHRKVAIKVLHSGVASDADAVARFEREAQAAGRIGSEHIVEVLDLGNLADGDRYMVMEYMDGDSLADRIQQRGRLTAQELYPIAVQLLDALIAAHAAGIIHRDLKPDNVYLVRRKNQDDFVKLLDFGISKFSAMGGEFSMTRTGAVMGTPYYMAPEQAKGARDIDHRVDLYAVGVILYESISGQVPFNADTFNELLFKIVLEAPPSISAAVPGLDPGFAHVIEMGMAREPAQRYQTAEQFQQGLHAWAQGAQVQQFGNMTSAAQTGAFRPATPAAGTASLGTGTPGTWSNTGTFGQTGTHIPKKSPVGMLVGVSLGALVLLGGGGFAAYRVTVGSGQDAAAAAAAADQDRARKEKEAKEKEALNAKLEQGRLAAERSKQETDQVKAQAADDKARMEEELKKRDLADAKRKADAEAALKSASRVRPTTAKPAETKPATQSQPATATTGRRIRTSL